MARSPRRLSTVILRLALLGVTMYPMLMAGVTCTQSSQHFLGFLAASPVPFAAYLLLRFIPGQALDFNPSSLSRLSILQVSVFLVTVPPPYLLYLSLYLCRSVTLFLISGHCLFVPNA